MQWGTTSRFLGIYDPQSFNDRASVMPMLLLYPWPYSKALTFSNMNLGEVCWVQDWLILPEAVQSVHGATESTSNRREDSQGLRGDVDLSPDLTRTQRQLVACRSCMNSERRSTVSKGSCRIERSVRDLTSLMVSLVYLLHMLMRG